MSGGDHFLGIDVGTSYVKVVIIDDKDEILASSAEKIGHELEHTIDKALNDALTSLNLEKKDIDYMMATGHGRDIVSFADNKRTEISCHAKGAFHYFRKQITIIDIGGQDTKVIKLDPQGKRTGFKMNRKCAAGTGAFLEEITNTLDIPMSNLNSLAARSNKDTALGSYCTVFAKTELLSKLKEGEKIEDIARSAFVSVVKRLQEMDILEGSIVMTGGVIAFNPIIAELLGEATGSEVIISPYPQMTGAFGAALYARSSHSSTME